MSIHDKYLFQFTRPQEARLADIAAQMRDGGFNSRARKRRDAFRRAMSVHAHDVSIHAPARGAT